MSLEQQVGARLSGLEAEIDGARAEWDTERRRLWERFRARIEALSSQLAMATQALRTELRVMPAGRREQVAAVFDWVSRFERRRQLVTEEIWDILREAREADRRWQVVMAARLQKLLGFRGVVVAEAEHAMHDALASETRGIGDTPEGRDLNARVAASLAGVRADLARATAELEASARRFFATPHPDWERAAEGFEQALTTRLGGGGGAAIARVAVKRVARAPAGPPKKMARVPKFLLNRFYQKGSLRATTAGVELTFVNPLAFCIFQGGDAPIVDGQLFPKERTALDTGDKRLVLAALSDKDYLKYTKGGTMKVTLEGLTLRPGAHVMKVLLEMRKLGWVELDIKDELKLTPQARVLIPADVKVFARVRARSSAFAALRGVLTDLSVSGMVVRLIEGGRFDPPREGAELAADLDHEGYVVTVRGKVTRAANQEVVVRFPSVELHDDSVDLGLLGLLAQVVARGVEGCDPRRFTPPLANPPAFMRLKSGGHLDLHVQDDAPPWWQLVFLDHVMSWSAETGVSTGIIDRVKGFTRHERPWRSLRRLALVVANEVATAKPDLADVVTLMQRTLSREGRGE